MSKSFLWLAHILGGIMLDDETVSIISMKLTSILLLLFAVMIGVNKGFIYMPISLAGIGIYFGLIAWDKFKKSNVCYFFLLILLSISLAFEVGSSFKLVVALSIVFCAFYYLHYKLIVK